MQHHHALNPSFEPRHLATMATYADDLAQAYPTATPDALADKLLTVFSADRPTRLHVASMALVAVWTASWAA